MTSQSLFEDFFFFLRVPEYFSGEHIQYLEAANEITDYMVVFLLWIFLIRGTGLR